jgi:hypothetical protein
MGPRAILNVVVKRKIPSPTVKEEVKKKSESTLTHTNKE